MSKNKKALSRDDRARRTFYWLVLPAFIIFALVIIVPFFLGFYYSLTDWKSVTQTKINFVGLKNFTDSFADTRFQYSLMITVIFALFNVVVVNFVSFGLALLVSSKIKLSNIFRAGFFIPNLIGGLVLGYIWQFIYNSVFPALGSAIGSQFLVENLFLGDVKLAVLALIITNTWQYAGYIMMIYFAALQNVPSSLVESASLDGANAFQRLKHII
ncbi:carbohydrate ABC transporter permease, partial [Granulicatella sp.]